MTTVAPRIGQIIQRKIKGDRTALVQAPSPGARFARIGTIYSRVTGLLKSKVIKPEDVPLWYKVYSAFPPKFEPKYDRPPVEALKINHIFYPEDKLRAKLKVRGSLNMLSNEITQDQELVAAFKIERKSSSAKSEEEIINEILKKQDSSLQDSAYQAISQ